MPVTIALVSFISVEFWGDRSCFIVQVIGVSPKSAVVSNLSAVSERESQPCIQAVVMETKKEPPAMFSKVS